MDQEYRPLKDLVYSYIAQKINAGELSAGDHVSEPTICEALGVSRTPVREALIQLATEGYLESTPRRGFSVRGIDQESAVEIYQVMGSLDGEAAFLACDRLEQKDISQMSFLIDSMDLALENGLRDRYDSMQREFHGTYWQRCGNSKLISLLDETNRYFIRIDYQSVDAATGDELMKRANAEHREVLEMFRKHEASAVRDYLRDVHWSTENARFNVW